MFEFEHRIFADTNGQREVVRQPKSIDEMLCHDITKEKVTEIFCIIDEFDKNLDVEMRKNPSSPREMGDGKKHRNRKGRLSWSEIMTILVRYHFGTYRNFKERYLNCVPGRMRRDFPDAVSYNRFVEAHAEGVHRHAAVHEAVRLREVHGDKLRGQRDDTRLPQREEVFQQGVRRAWPRTGRARWDDATASSST